MIWNFLSSLLGRRRPLAMFGRTDTGRVRPNNEDSFVVLPELNLMMVADGMGGHRAGEVASRLAIDTMVPLLSREAMQAAGASPEAVRHLIIRSLRRMNERLMEAAGRNPDYAGMGSTFIVGYVDRGRLFTCHVGDVRAYLLEADALRQLTVDHTYAAAGSLNNRHILSRAVGFPWPEDPDCSITQVSRGQRLLLCSDGLWSMLPDERLSKILARAASPEAACDRLVAAANQAGGQDNISAVVCFM